jgi:hypothetical protein
MLEYTSDCKSVYAVKFDGNYDVVVSNSNTNDFCVASRLTQTQAESVVAWFTPRLDLPPGLLSIHVVGNTLVIGGANSFVIKLDEGYTPAYCASVLAGILDGDVISN